MPEADITQVDTGASVAERDAKIVEFAKAGCVLDDIGRTFGISRERVRQILNSNGYSRSDKIREDHDTIRAMLAAGSDLASIADAIKRDESYVAHFCRQHRIRPSRDASVRVRKCGVRSEGHASPLTQHVDTIKAYAARGWSTSAIAALLRVKYASLYSFRRTHAV